MLLTFWKSTWTLTYKAKAQPIHLLCIGSSSGFIPYFLQNITSYYDLLGKRV